MTEWKLAPQLLAGQNTKSNNKNKKKLIYPYINRIEEQIHL